jgi:hypothetical protein
MQLFTLPIAVVALLLAGHTTAIGCTVGVKYCGNTLYNIGKFTSCPFLHPQTVLSHRLMRAADRLGLEQSECSCARGLAAQKSREAIKSELFECRSGTKLKYISTCYKGCVDAGDGKSDYCK